MPYAGLPDGAVLLDNPPSTKQPQYQGLPEGAQIIHVPSAAQPQSAQDYNDGWVDVPAQHAAPPRVYNDGWVDVPANGAQIDPNAKFDAQGQPIIDVTPTSGDDLSVAEKLNNPYFGINTAEKLRAEIAKAGKGALMGIGAGVGGVAGFASPLPGGAAAGTLLGGGIGKKAGELIFGPDQPEAPAANPAAGQGFTANAKEMLSNIPGSAVKTANGALGMMSDLSTAAVTPGGGAAVLNGVSKSIKDLGSRDAWVTNPVGNAATLGMIAEPVRVGASGALGKVGLTPNPELTTLSKNWEVPLTAGMEAQSPALNQLSTSLERVPIVGTRGAMKAGSAAMGDAAARLVDKFTPDNPVDVPDQIQTSMLKTLKQGKSDVGNIQSQINEAVKSGDVGPIKPDNLREAATSLLAEFPDIFDRLPSTPLKSKLTAIADGASDSETTSPILDAQGQPVKQTVPAALSWDQAMKLREQLNDYIGRAYNSSGAVGSKETYQLTAIKRALDQDITDWGENSANTNVVDLFKQRNQMYQDKVAPFKDVIVKKATGNAFDTDLLYNQFIKADRPQLAQKLMDALDPEGQQLVKYQVLKKALEAGQDTKPGVPFSPAKFAKVIENLGATKSVIFPGAEGTMIEGFVKLARAGEEYGQFAADPPNGIRVGDQGMYLGGGIAAGSHPFATMGALGVTKLLSTLLTTPRGKAILMKAAKTPDGPALMTVLRDVLRGNSQVPTVTP